MGNKITHPSHPEHPLKLNSSKKIAPAAMSHGGGDGGGIRCSLCNTTRRTSKKLYACLSCNYYVDLLCASLKETRSLPAHKDHRLALVTDVRPATASDRLVCRACGIQITGWRYSCSSCDYDVHGLCSMLPSAAKFKLHKHPLYLDLPRPDRGSSSCDLCGVGDHGAWGYRCKRKSCRGYYIHLDCNAFNPLHNEEQVRGGRFHEEEEKGDADPLEISVGVAKDLTCAIQELTTALLEGTAPGLDPNNGGYGLGGAYTNSGIIVIVDGGGAGGGACGGGGGGSACGGGGSACGGGGSACGGGGGSSC